MPFCTECGARHAEGARVCPNCGEPTFEPPGDEDLNDIVASLDEGATMGDELPDFDAPASRPPTGDYMEQIDEVRVRIAAQSTSLQSLAELSWANPQAVQIREQLAAALEVLHGLRPPAPLASGHADFVEGAELLADGFTRLVDSSQRGDAEAAVAAAESAIAEATTRFLRGADALNEYFTLQEAGLADEPLPTPPTIEDEDDQDEELPDVDDIPPPPSFDDLELPEEPAAAAPARARSLFAPAPLAPPAAAYAPPPRTAPPPLPEPEYDYTTEAQAGAWSGLGDPETDRLLIEIESAWVRARPRVHDAIERAIRSAVVDALRSSLGTRLRIEQDARASLERIASDRNRLIDEVESLRRDAHSLQSELAELRRGLNELERERQIAQDRRQQMFADAEAHRAQLLREIEQLGGQLDSMRQSIVSLLNISSSVPAQLAAMEDLPEDGRPLASGTPLPAPGAPNAEAHPRSAPAATQPRGSFATASPAAASSTGSLTSRAPVARASVPARGAPPSASSLDTTEVRIGGVTSLGKNLQIQQAIKALPGVTVDGQPKYRNGVITAILRHDPSFDVADALGALPEQPLSLTGSPAPGVLELAAP